MHLDAVYTRTFFMLNASACCSPSRSTAIRPGLMEGVAAVGATTVPVRLLYFASSAEVSKTVVTVVPGGGDGVRLRCC